jgi:hypothetical protein
MIYCHGGLIAIEQVMIIADQNVCTVQLVIVHQMSLNIIGPAPDNIFLLSIEL